MVGLGVATGSVQTKHSVRVEWFLREPGGTTIFIMPPGADDTTPQYPTSERLVDECGHEAEASQ